MTAKKNSDAQGTAHALKVKEDPKKTREQQLAEIAIEPEVSAAFLVEAHTRGTYGATDFTALVDALKDATAEVQAGKLGRGEAMLVSQAYILNSLFTELVRRAGANYGQFIEAAETYMKLALRAQSQCRATWETVATMKNPPVVIAKQANIAHGPQQVNNGQASDVPEGVNVGGMDGVSRPVRAHATRAEQKANQPTELLGNNHGERLDTGTKGTASARDPIMATVGAVHRADDKGR